MSVLRRQSGSGGFTFIELMVVIAIIGILAAAAVVQLRSSVLRAREATLKHDLAVFRDLINQFKADKQKYPESLESLVEEGYLRSLPVDPITGSASTWIAIQNTDSLDFEDPLADSGVIDVQSGAEGLSLDGTAYSEW